MLRLSTYTASKRLAAFGLASAAGSSVYHHYTQEIEAQYGIKPTTVTQAEPISRKQIEPLATSMNSSSTTSEIDLNSILDSCQEKVSQLKPLLEASTRAVKLVITVFLVISDYKLDEYKYKYEEHLQKALQLIGMKSSTNHSHENLKSLEKSLQLRSQKLQDAQKDYAASDEKNNARSDKDNTNAANERARQEHKERQRKAVLEAARQLAQAEEALAQAQTEASNAAALLSTNSDTEGEIDNTIHACAARRIRDLCRSNGGTYIKVGQHLANLDHLLPPAYIQVLQSLFGDAPTTNYDNVREVVWEELGEYPEELFDEFERVPIASASLAQVHIAKKDGQTLAIKVQHRGLRETSKGDLIALEGVVRLVDRLFDEFKWGWIVDEIAPNLPKELDFKHEGRNAETAVEHIRKAGLGSDCIVPKIHWDLTTSRVLVMDFEHGHSVTDIKEIEKAGIRKRDLAVLISSVFQSQIFQSGHVHCDPHPANVFWRRRKDGKPQLVLFDHGLYKQIDDDFRLTYARLWKSLLMADINGIKESCSSLGVKEMYPLLSAMLTSRPFDEIMERSKSRSFTAKDADCMDVNSDAAMIRGYAQQYLKEIIQMLDKVPPQMLLLFKMNDCLRHIDHALGSPANTMVVAGKYAAQTVYDNERDVGGVLGRLRLWMSHFIIMTRIRAFEFVSNTSLFSYTK